MGIRNKVTGEMYSITSYNPTTGNITGINNTTGNSDLGNVSNIYIGGGNIGEVLSTDGLGNLSWIPAGGGANTGNVTFDDQIVIGTGDEFGGGGLYLAMGPTSAANLQYLRVRGGDYPTHIHLDTGNNAYYDQYFGDDNKYVKLENTGNIIIGAYQDGGPNAQWNFSYDGNVTVPGNIQAITTGFSFTSSISGINTGSPTVIVTLTDSVFGSTQTGQVTITGVTGTTEADGTWYFQSIDPSNFVLYYDAELNNPVDGTTWTAYVSGGLAVAQGYSNVSITGGNVDIITNGGDTWTFGDTGLLTLPGGAVIDSADDNFEVRSVDNVNFEATSDLNISTGGGLNQWTFDSTGNLTIPGTSGGLIKTVANASIGIVAMDDGTDNPAQVMSWNVGGAPTTIISAYSTNATIQTNAAASINTWQFLANSVTVFPGDLIGSGASPAPSINGFDSASFSGNVTADYFIGNGSQLTSLPVAAIIANGNSNVSIAAADGPILMFDGSSRVASISTERVAIGDNAGITAQNIFTVAVGYEAGNDTQGIRAVAIGFQAGADTQGGDAIAMGSLAGNASQSAYSIAIGSNAAAVSQGTNAIAIGQLSGNNNQNANSIAIGFNAGTGFQAGNSVAIGVDASSFNQGVNAVSVGGFAGTYNQANGAVAMGGNAAYSNQGVEAIAVGYNAGSGFQGNTAIAIGSSAANSNQGIASIAIGVGAGSSSQGNAAIAIGKNAGASSQGANSVAIGALAGNSIQIENSIVINATGVDLPAAGNGLYIAPVRNDTANIVQSVYYNTSTKEITYAVAAAPSIGTMASGANITPTTSTAQYNVTALAVASNVDAPTGTPLDGQKLTIRLLDNGTGQSLTWDAVYQVIGTTLPTTTVANKYMYVGCIYNAQVSKWDVVSVAQQA